MFYEMIKRRRDLWLADPSCPALATINYIEDVAKTGRLWDGTLACPNKPLRIKVRNICGDESVFDGSSSSVSEN